MDITEESIDVYVETEKPTPDTPSQSTPMRPEHIPTKTETFRPLVFNVIEPQLIEPTDEMVKQPVQAEMKLMNDSIIEKIDDALLLSEGDLRGFNLNHSKLESLLQDSVISNDKASEKLEKEKSKRKFCENKIIQLQKDIITLEENNFVLKENCAKKNLVLSEVNKNLSDNKLEIENFARNKNAIIRELRNTVDYLQNSIKRANEDSTKKGNEIENLVSENRKINDELATTRNNLDERNQHIDKLQIDFDILNEEKTDISKSLEATITEGNTKVANLKRLLDAERAKVAKFETEESSTSVKAKSLSNALETLRLDFAQMKKLKDDQLRKFNIEKSAYQKRNIEFQEKQKFDAAAIDKKNEEIKSAKNEVKAAKQNTDVVQQEMIALQAELDLLKQTSASDRTKLESFHKSLLHSKIEELEKHFKHEMQILKESHMTEIEKLTESLDRKDKENTEKLVLVEKSLKRDYQMKMKTFLQKHFNQGLSAMMSDVDIVRNAPPIPQPNIPVQSSFSNFRRSSSPRESLFSPIHCPEPIISNQDVTENTETDREINLRRSIEKLLNTKPSSKNRKDSTDINSRLKTLFEDKTLSENEKKIISRTLMHMK